MSGFDEILSQLDWAKQKMQGKPYNKRHVPAKKYVGFDDFFTTYMTKIQEQVEQVKKQRAPYMALVDALRDTEKDYPQIFRIDTDNRDIVARTELQSNQHWSTFTNLAEQTKKNLVKCGFIEEDDTAKPYFDCDVSWRFAFYVGSVYMRVTIVLEVPPTGNDYRREEMVTKYLPAVAASSYITKSYTWDGDPDKEMVA